MFKILCFNKEGNKQITTLKTPIIPRIGETIIIDTPNTPNGIYKTTGKVYDVGYSYNKNCNLEYILIFLDTAY